DWDKLQINGYFDDMFEFPTEKAKAITTVEKGSNLWDSAQKMVKSGDITEKQFKEAWSSKASQVELPSGKTVHISEVGLTHEGDQLAFIPASEDTPAHFKVTDYPKDELNLGSNKELVKAFEKSDKDIPQWLRKAEDIPEEIKLEKQNSVPINIIEPEVEIDSPETTARQIEEVFSEKAGKTKEEISKKAKDYLVHYQNEGTAIKKEEAREWLSKNISPDEIAGNEDLKATMKKIYSRELYDKVTGGFRGIFETSEKETLTNLAQTFELKKDNAGLFSEWVKSSRGLDEEGLSEFFNPKSGELNPQSFQEKIEEFRQMSQKQSPPAKTQWVPRSIEFQNPQREEFEKILNARKTKEGYQLDINGDGKSDLKIDSRKGLNAKKRLKQMLKGERTMKIGYAPEIQTMLEDQTSQTAEEATQEQKKVSNPEEPTETAENEKAEGQEKSTKKTKKPKQETMKKEPQNEQVKNKESIPQEPKRQILEQKDFHQTGDGWIKPEGKKFKNVEFKIETDNNSTTIETKGFIKGFEPEDWLSKEWDSVIKKALKNPDTRVPVLRDKIKLHLRSLATDIEILERLPESSQPKEVMKNQIKKQIESIEGRIDEISELEDIVKENTKLYEIAQ
ncbi:MAG: hypothetical protein ABEI53_03255, partial [Candidatus Magasanikbacteria bacterium]